ncbi:MAG: hypothetical protein HC773_22125 [Scytonema sp. CRU_2_7]|nr:hypothetical protein [Scytonema sp. CRU_2_7]
MVKYGVVFADCGLTRKELRCSKIEARMYWCFCACSLQKKAILSSGEPKVISPLILSKHRLYFLFKYLQPTPEKEEPPR